MKLVPLSGSTRLPLRDCQTLGPAHPEEKVEVTVRVRRRHALPCMLQTHTHGGYRRYYTHDQLAIEHGADQTDITRVGVYAKAVGLTVVDSSVARRSVMLGGTVKLFEKAFGVKLERCDHPTRGGFRSRAGPVYVPADLVGIIEGVFGLDTRPFARSHTSRRNVTQPSPASGFSPKQVAELYNFPQGLDGSGQTIGIIELGGGYRPEDLQSYFRKVGVPVPHINSVSVDHGHNLPTTADSADGEVMLDIEVVASIAPKARLVIYFAQNATDRDFLDAMTTAVHDAVHKPSVISVSWGGPEESTTADFQKQFNDVLHSAAALGITVTVASGDSGAADQGPNEWDGKVHADFPASSPYALACGGTKVIVAGNQLMAEKVWNQNAADPREDSFGSSGGGISTVFPVPPYQSHLKLPINATTGKPGRGLPDVAADADPSSGYQVRVDGKEFPIGGTSAVAPLFAGLITLCNQSLGRRVGFVNPILYANPSAFHDIVNGSNRVGPGRVGYDAAPGWDACTGLGSPDGQKVLAVLAGV